MKADEVIKSIKCCTSSPKVDRCKSECIFFRNDLDMSKCIKAMGETSADLLERLQAKLEAITRDRDQWRVAAEASRDVIQPKLRAEIEELKAVQPVKGEWLNFTNDFSTAECDKCGEVYEVSPDEEPCEDYFKAFKKFYNFCPNCGADMRKES